MIDLILVIGDMLKDVYDVKVVRSMDGRIFFNIVLCKVKIINLW